MEFVHFHADEAQTEQEGQEQPAVDCFHTALAHTEHRHAVRNTTEQQEEGFYQNERQFKNVFTSRATRGPVHQHRVSCEQARKQYAVTHQVDPEAEDFGLTRVVCPCSAWAASWLVRVSVAM